MNTISENLIMRLIIESVISMHRVSKMIVNVIMVILVMDIIVYVSEKSRLAIINAKCTNSSHCQTNYLCIIEKEQDEGYCIKETDFNLDDLKVKSTDYKKWIILIITTMCTMIIIGYTIISLSNSSRVTRNIQDPEYYIERESEISDSEISDRGISVGGISDRGISVGGISDREISVDISSVNNRSALITHIQDSKSFTENDIEVNPEYYE